MISDDILQQFQAKLSQLKADNDDEAAKTIFSNQSDTEAARAAAKASQAKADELSATQKTQADVTDLIHFAESLATVTP